MQFVSKVNNLYSQLTGSVEEQNNDDLNYISSYSKTDNFNEKSKCENFLDKNNNKNPNLKVLWRKIKSTVSEFINIKNKLKEQEIINSEMVSKYILFKYMLIQCCYKDFCIKLLKANKLSTVNQLNEIFINNNGNNEFYNTNSMHLNTEEQIESNSNNNNDNKIYTNALNTGNNNITKSTQNDNTNKNNISAIEINTNQSNQNQGINNNSLLQDINIRDENTNEPNSMENNN